MSRQALVKVRCYRCKRKGYWPARVYPGCRPVCSQCLRAAAK